VLGCAPDLLDEETLDESAETLKSFDGSGESGLGLGERSLLTYSAYMRTFVL
jgi:hypothetical protein